METAIKAPRGTRDVLGDESWKWAHVLDVCRDVARDFGYSEVLLPIFEHTELFCRGIGDATDVVEKEMYTFIDKGDRSITLRPELTASMARSYLEHDMRRAPQPVKLWSAGPMFRYERPQKGRYRQFWQTDFEILGVQDPMADLETIDTSMEIYRRLGLTNLQVLINSVGCPKCRPAYRDALKRFIESGPGGLEALCETCRGRFDRNPLRILDCKKLACKEITEGAPAILDSLCDECAAHFEDVTRGLERIGADARLDKRLVRGLDYYTKTAFEILAGELGSQNAVCGGGRYDNLAEAIGGPSVPGVGFASGIERIVITLEGQGVFLGDKPHVDVYVVTASNGLALEAAALAHELRASGIAADTDYAGRGMKAQMKQAAASGAAFVCIIGEDEAASGTVSVKNMSDGEQRSIARNEAASKLALWREERNR
ncbi:MAG: histidine--tRNA ligase [Synergistaceae bacterium]|jgi:histidyl-tRNA synthetase|nr:histidine--tRNA ligase [Synergistaceae bacterium]